MHTQVSHQLGALEARLVACLARPGQTNSLARRLSRQFGHLLGQISIDDDSSVRFVSFQFVSFVG